MNVAAPSSLRKLTRSFITVSFVVFSLLTLGTATALAQGGTGSTPLATSPGTPAGSYALSNVDSVNLYNGRVNVHIPLLDLAGRGGSGVPVSMTWDSPANWHVNKYYDVNGTPHYAAEQGQPGAGDGLHYGLYGVQSVGSGAGAQNPCNPDTPDIWQMTLTRMSIIEPDGTEHELRDLVNGGQPFIGQSTCYGPGPSRGRVFVTTDGSGMTYVADDVIRDGVHVGNEMPTGGGGGGWLLLKDGKRYRTSGLATYMRDRNGNWAASDQDSLNRRITQTQGTDAQCASLGTGASDFCYSITYKGFGGADRLIWVSYDITTRPYLIVLPNNLRYRFYYNTYGDMTRLDLPTGGSIEYDYEPGLSGPQLDTSGMPGSIPGIYSGGPPNITDFHVYRRVTQRRVYREGHVLENWQSFTKPEDTQGDNLGYVEKKWYDANNNLLSSEKHYFYGSANASFSLDVMAYPAWRDGREYRAEIYDEHGNLLRQTDQTWEQRVPGADTAPANDPRIVETTTRLENGLTSRTTYAYDPTVPYNSLTDVFVYGYDGQLLRHTKTTYLKNQNGVDYTGSNLYTDSNPQANSTPYLRDLPLQVSVFDAWGERARTTYEYDNYTPDAGNKHAALINYSDISGLCIWYNSSGQCTNTNPSDASDPSGYKTRGNVTSVSKWLLANDGTSISDPLTAYMQYDVGGNVVKTIDEHGNETQISYNDRFGMPDAETQSNTQPTQWLTSGQSHAFATKTVNALGFTTYAQFDYYTGKAVNTEDANGTMTSASYDDLLDRPKQIVTAVNITSLKHRSTFEYDDTNRVVTSYEDQTADNDRAFHKEVSYDGLGRTKQSRVYDDANAPSQYVLVTTDYDFLGRVVQVSNPYKPALNETPVYTLTEYDALSRVKKVTAPGSKPVVTEYAGNTVTVTDQAGNKRASNADALGRIAQVVEDPGGYGYVTDYTYDGLGNLRKVKQSSQQGFQERYFAYDSLSRLVRTSNPEQETNTNLSALTDPITTRTQWSTAYTYDVINSANTATDARGVVTTAVFDRLGRVETVTYTNDPTNTPQVTFIYDAASVLNSKGRLTSVSSSVSTYNYTEYDALGRIKGSSQVTGGQTYTMSYAYDLAGEMTSETYPSGRVETTGYDVAGRVTGLDGQSGGQTTHYVSAIKYWSSGAVKEAQLGNGLVEHNLLNDRLQPKEIDLGTSNTDSSVLKLEYTYGVLDGAGVLDATKNNGNVQSQKITVPGIASPLTQTYTYDSLNRLKVAQENGGASWKQTFIYDQYGNRSVDADNTTTDAVGDNPQVSPATNRIAPRQGEHYHYDKSGNLDQDKQGATFTYDANDRVAAFNGGAAGTNGTNYSFDGLGQRVRKADYSTSTVFVYDAMGKMVAEYSNEAASGAGTSYLTADALGTPRVVTGTSAAGATVKSRHDYLPFGEEIGGAQVGLKGGRTAGQMYVSDNLRQKFTGQERDAESGLDYFLARDYASTHGRFTSVDPLMSSAKPINPQTWNRYSYAGNNPLKYIDPSGMNYFVGGSGAADPFIPEYRFDGFEQSPEGTASNLDTEEMAGLDPQMDDLNQPVPSAGTVDDAGNIINVSANGTATIVNAQGQEVVSYSANSIMVIVWNPQEGSSNPTFRFGHVSYVFMQSDMSLSWEGYFNWTVNTPSSDYTDKRSTLSEGRGYVLDFGPKINAKFQAAILSAYVNAFAGPAYNPVLNNCAKAFSIGMNAIRKDIDGSLPRMFLILPGDVKTFIERDLPKQYWVASQQFPKH